MSIKELHYRAFLSYSHKDSRIARRLHRRLESYRLPKSLGKSKEGTGNLPLSRIRPVFRDRDELASASSLTGSIKQALDDSEALIVICSPAAASSQWVNEEIRYFREHHPNRLVFPFVVAGDPDIDVRQDPENAALPLYLLLKDIDQPLGDVVEPVAADARSEADGFTSAFLKLAAGLIGVPYDGLRQRELVRRQKNWMIAGTASLILAVVFAAMAWRATVARNEARTARVQAELELISERQTREFLLSVFQLADPGEARGETITVREVLDSAVERIDNTEFARPVIRSRYLATMGQAYSALSLNRRSIELLQSSLDALPNDELGTESQMQRIDSQLEMADVWFDMGDYDAALEALETTSGRSAPQQLTPLQEAYASNIRGDILAFKEQDDEAMAAYLSALDALTRATPTREQKAYIQSRSVGGIAILHHFAGEYPQALSKYSEAVNILLPVFGERHPDTIWAMVSWGAAAYSVGDTKTAHDTLSRSLDVALDVLDDTSPIVGIIKNNLGRLLLESGEYLEAEVLLRDALAIDRLHRTEEFDDLSFTLNNLALTQMAQGKNEEAEGLLLEAMDIAKATQHRMLGPIMCSLADIKCLNGDAAGGNDLAAQSVMVNEDEYGVEDWRTKRSVMTEGYCQTLLGEPVDLAALDVARLALLERWGMSNYFSLRANQQGELINKDRDRNPPFK